MHTTPKQNKHHRKTRLLPKAKFLNTGSSVKFLYPPLQHLASPQALSNFPMEDFTYLCCVSILATIAPVLDHMTWITATYCSLISLSPTSLFCNRPFLFSSDTSYLGLPFLMLFSSSKILNDSISCCSQSVTSSRKGRQLILLSMAEVGPVGQSYRKVYFSWSKEIF